MVEHQGSNTSQFNEKQTEAEQISSNTSLTDDAAYTSSPELHFSVFLTCCIYLCIVGVGGAFFNLAIFTIYWTRRLLWTDFNLLLMNLILAELLVSLYGIPVDFMASLQGGWKMGSIMCQATGFILTTLGMSSMNSLMGLSVYRWILIKHEGNKLFRYKRRTILILITFSWFWSIFLSLPPLIGWGKYLPEVNGISCAPSWGSSFDRSYNIFLFSFGFFLPLFIIIYTSIIVVKTVKEALSTICVGDIKNKALKKQYKVMKMVLALAGVFVFCWAPYAALSLAGIFGQAQSIPLILTVFPLQMAKSSILWNPLIFVIMNPMFQSAAHSFTKEWFGWFGTQNQDESDSLASPRHNISPRRKHKHKRKSVPVKTKQIKDYETIKMATIVKMSNKTVQVEPLG